MRSYSFYVGLATLLSASTNAYEPQNPKTEINILRNKLSLPIIIATLDDGNAYKLLVNVTGTASWVLSSNMEMQLQGRPGRPSYNVEGKEEIGRFKQEIKNVAVLKGKIYPAKIQINGSKEFSGETCFKARDLAIHAANYASLFDKSQAWYHLPFDGVLGIGHDCTTSTAEGVQRTEGKSRPSTASSFSAITKNVTMYEFTLKHGEEEGGSKFSLGTKDPYDDKHSWLDSRDATEVDVVDGSKYWELRSVRGTVRPPVSRLRTRGAAGYATRGSRMATVELGDAVLDPTDPIMTLPESLTQLWTAALGEGNYELPTGNKFKHLGKRPFGGRIIVKCDNSVKMPDIIFPINVSEEEGKREPLEIEVLGKSLRLGPVPGLGAKSGWCYSAVQTGPRTRLTLPFFQWARVRLFKTCPKKRVSLEARYDAIKAHL